MKKDKFWINKKLTELSHSEWEALCDNCGKCCVIKLQNENVLKLMKDFVKRVKANKEKIVKFVNKKITENKKIYLYGASTKGNTFLQYYKLDHKKIPFAH